MMKLNRISLVFCIDDQSIKLRKYPSFYLVISTPYLRCLPIFTTPILSNILGSFRMASNTKEKSNCISILILSIFLLQFCILMLKTLILRKYTMHVGTKHAIRVIFHLFCLLFEEKITSWVEGRGNTTGSGSKKVNFFISCYYK